MHSSRDLLLYIFFSYIAITEKFFLNYTNLFSKVPSEILVCEWICIR